MARASQASIDEELDRLERLVVQHPGGISRSALGLEYARVYGRKLSRRTLLRRLDELFGAGRVRPEGESRARVYKPLSSPAAGGGAIAGERGEVDKPMASKAAPVQGYPPLSGEGRDVWALMQRPIVEREPVGYDRRLLDRYVPGQTWYLPRTLRRRLHEVGRTPDPTRPAGTFARDILGRLLIDLAWASSRLEENAYSRLDTQNLIEFGQRVKGADVTEAQMILNHKSAIEYLVDAAGQIDLDRATLVSLHALLSENLLPDARDEGRLRVHPVAITGTVYTPVGVGQVIEEYFDRLVQKGAAIEDPFEQAFFSMVHIPYLRPFADVNKRTSRLAANIPLIRGNLCPLSFLDVPKQAYVEGTLAVYENQRVELLRDVFEWAYERSCAQYRVVRDSLFEPDPVRLRYRSEIAVAVRETVLSGRPPRREVLREWAERTGISPDDLDDFAERTMSVLVNLNEGTAGRYRLRPSEFSAWRGRFTGGGTTAASE
jgi:hypothetical protein